MKSPIQSLIPFLSILLFFTITATALGGGKVGGRTPVKDVESNKEVQDLGRYCVLEYNRRLQHQGANGSKLLQFSRVVAAETQVVSGIKYYLKIAAASRGGGRGPATYEAVVVVKAWMKSKELVDFAPVPSLRNTK